MQANHEANHARPLSAVSEDEAIKEIYLVLPADQVFGYAGL